MILAAMILLGAVTFFYRFAFMSPLGQKWADRVPSRFLQLLAPATFAAIVINSLISAQNTADALRPRLIVALTSLAVAYWTKNILATLVFGLSLLYFLTSVA